MFNSTDKELGVGVNQQELFNQQLVVEVWDPQLTQAQIQSIASFPGRRTIPGNSVKDSVRNDISTMSELDSQEFGSRFGMDLSEAIGYLIYNLKSVTCVLRDRKTGKIEGFTIAIPARDAYIGNSNYSYRNYDDKTVYIVTTVLDPKIRGQKQVARLMVELEKELRAKGYKFIDRDASDKKQLGARSYADKVIIQAGDRVVHQKAFDTPIGPQRYIKMRL